jgi:hypothetical protein
MTIDELKQLQEAEPEVRLAYVRQFNEGCETVEQADELIEQELERTTS